MTWLDLLEGVSGADRAAARDAMRRGGQAAAEAELLARGVGRGEILRALAAAYACRPADLAVTPPDPEAARLLPEWFARRHRVVPVARDADRVVLACQDPSDLPAIDAASMLLGAPVDVRVALAQDLDAVLIRVWGPLSGESRRASLEVAARAMHALSVDSGEPAGELGALLAEAALRAATDVHLQPDESGGAVLLRVDGVLHALTHIGAGPFDALVRQIKVRAGMDPSNTLRPQDGRMSASVWGEELDLRVAALPALHGEHVTVRILRPRSAAIGVRALGLAEDQVAALREAVRGHGLLLLCGPAGSGKTTTSAAIIRDMVGTRHVLTVEDPVEYRLGLVHTTQVEVSERAGRGFADVLRAALRHDPEVLVVGEVRDAETAGLAVRYALSGHLVIATVHAGGPGQAVRRLVDWGVQPAVLSGALRMVVHQRLVRRACRSCAGAGCADCWGSGYRGRIGVFELRAAGEVSARDGEELWRRAMDLVRKGVTTEEELERVLGGIVRPRSRTTAEEVLA
jgi:type II secretory ATPase GspE/PulE/Tfp pilus assembly ATPase PilB-like protein